MNSPEDTAQLERTQLERTLTPAQLKLKQLLASRGIQKNIPSALAVTSTGIDPRQHSLANTPLTAPETPESTTQTGELILNSEQLQAVDLAGEGKEFCLIGSAGSGKTTTLKLVVQNLMRTKGIEPDSTADGTIAVVCYTRRAARNAAKALTSVGASKFCMTAHRFLEYQPEYIDYQTESGDWKTTMRFVPNRDAYNPISNCSLVIIDEASMMGYETLYKELRSACPNAMFIYVGDLNQLKPVFGDAVLGHALYKKPVVELTKIYRQAMDSPIVAFQHNWTLKGRLPGDSDLDRISESCTDETGLQFVPFKMAHQDGEVLAQGVVHYMIRMYESGIYDPLEDTILIPFNKSFGSVAINWHLAEYLGQKRGAEVWEVIGARHTKYFAVGDFVMFEKAECTIIDIKHNPKYWGKAAQEPSVNLLRSGILKGSVAEAILLRKDHHDDFVPMGFEELLKQDASESESSKAMSAVITLRDNDTGAETVLSTSGDLANLDFGYCMTIHKSQGSEWRKVWLVMHKVHATMLSRELLYTGMTRARERLCVIYSKQTAIGRKDSSIAKAIKKQSIPGATWREKARYFADKGK